MLSMSKQCGGKEEMNNPDAGRQAELLLERLEELIVCIYADLTYLVLYSIHIAGIKQ